jgi:drug/metabolite transporter (DMT)-like permease
MLGLLVALSYGAGDFAGGVVSKRMPPAIVVAASQGFGLVALSLALLWPGQEPVTADLWRGVAAGVAGLLGLVLLYRGLSVGAMSVVAPVTAAGSAVVPFVWGVVTGERPSVLGVGGVVLAVVAVGLVATPANGESPPDLRRELALALVAGVAFGGVFIALGDTSPAAGIWPVVLARVTSVGLLVTILLVRRVPIAVPAGSRVAIAVTGLLDVTANALFVVAARQGLLSLVAPVSALYPVATVALAAVFLHERVAPRQRVGLGCALVGVLLIAR